MDALGQDLDLERARGHAAQAGGEPQLVVVARARIQAHHQRHVAHAGLQRIDVGQQIARAAFFAGLDEADDARVRNALPLELLNGGDAGVDRVAVVGAAAAVELAVLVLGRPGAEVVAPAAEFGLLVQMAVHQYGVGGAGLGRVDLEEQHRRAAFEADHFEFQAFDLLRFDPRGGVAHHGVQQALLGPVGREHGRLGGDGDVVGELANNVVVPGLAHPFKGQRRLQDLGGNTGVHGHSLLKKPKCRRAGRGSAIPTQRPWPRHAPAQNLQPLPGIGRLLSIA